MEHVTPNTSEELRRAVEAFMRIKRLMNSREMFRGNAAMYRAVTNPVWWHAGYWLITLGEACTGGLLGLGTISLWRHRHASGEAFGAAKKWVIVGAALGFLVWFFGFMVVGGEWFLMWQSRTWNGQKAAFRFYAAILGVLLFVNQHDGDLIPAPV